MKLFLYNFIKKPHVIGAIAPSSSFLAKRMIEKIDFSRTQSIVELGPGTGVFTELVLKKMHEKTTYFALEIDQHMHEQVKHRFPHADIYNESATELKKYMRLYQMTGIDVVISGLPWAIFSNKLQDEIMGEMYSALAIGGQFSTFAYVHGLVLPPGIRFQKKLNQLFSRVEKSPIVWLNMPPAFVYWCKK